MKNKTSVSFLLNGEPVTVDFFEAGIKPSTTLLNWLRKDHHSEVKEGCAEGDCGACTVVIAEPDKSKKKLVYKAVNSCLLFLPMVDGKIVITSRGLSGETTEADYLHPVQRSIVEAHATQCGFCTPGFVMSLFAMYRDGSENSDEAINHALAGNLCRCTGYDSIRRAAKKALTAKRSDAFSRNEKALMEKLSHLKMPASAFDVSVCQQHYMKPADLKHALELRKKYPSATIVNGATDAALAQSKHFRHIPEILDVSMVDEIKSFRFDGKNLHIGAGLPLEIVRTKARETLPALYEILSVFASRQIRNVATLGGNIGSASPIGDTTPLLMALDAVVTLQSTHTKSTLPLRGFITGYRETMLAGDELITSIKIPLPGNDEKIKMYKVSKRQDMDISTVSAAFRLKPGKGNTVASFRAYFGGMAAWTKEAEKTVAFLSGKKWNEKNILEAMQILKSEFTPISDARSGVEFRNAAAANLLMMFFNDTKGTRHEK